MVPQIIKRKQNHMVPHVIPHLIPYESTFNHKETKSHGSPCESVKHGRVWGPKLCIFIT
jgi:hypothetical protein